MPSKERSKTKQRKKTTQLQKVLKDYQDGIFVLNPNVVTKMAKHQ